jgi:hypothetical protein
MVVARPSRPPGFDMTYRPAETVFGPPLAQRLPSFIYLFAALAVAAVVAIAERSPPGSTLYDWVIARDAARLITSRTLAIVLLAGAVASLVRASMRGVRVRGDGVEYRDVLPLGWPRVRRYKWAQIDRIVLDTPRAIALDLWDGTRAFLPRVNDRSGLSAALEKVAAARAIPVRGGAGLDEIPERAEFDSEDA